MIIISINNHNFKVWWHFWTLTTLSLEMSDESFFLWFLTLSVLKFGHLISLCMNKIYNSIKEACQYVGIVALACGSALVLLIMGNKRKCWGAWGCEWDAFTCVIGWIRIWLILCVWGWNKNRIKTPCGHTLMLRVIDGECLCCPYVNGIHDVHQRHLPSSAMQHFAPQGDKPCLWQKPQSCLSPSGARIRYAIRFAD